MLLKVVAFEEEATAVVVVEHLCLEGLGLECSGAFGSTLQKSVNVISYKSES